MSDEKKTIRIMIRMFCRANHYSNKLCENCSRLEKYALSRIDACVFGPHKPVCNKCKVHCYKSAMRETVREVMRYAGPRMIFRHPILTVLHTFRSKRSENYDYLLSNETSKEHRLKGS